MKFSLALGVLLSSFALAGKQERDYLGWPFDPKLFPPCLKYGCTFTRERFDDPLDGGLVYVSLKKIPAKLRLYLSPRESVMGLAIIVPGETLKGEAQALVQRTMNNAADQNFPASILPGCLKKTWLKAPTQGNFEQRGFILGGNGAHYGVECMTKRYAGVHYVGVLVFFDV